MEFRLLGPVSLYIGDENIALGGTKPRTLLATLLLERQRVVPTASFDSRGGALR